MLLVILLLAVLLAFFLTKWLLLRRELGAMADTVLRLRDSGGNQRITVTSQDPRVIRLATAINTLYDDRYREQGEHAHAMAEIRQNMASISHDLRTPLTSIIGYVNLLRHEDNTPEQNAHYLSVIDNKAAALGQLVSSLFELARLESGVYPFTMERVDAGEILSEELAGFYEAFAQADRQPDIHLSPAPLWMRGDRMALGRVFSNLLRNMLQHGGEDACISAGREAGKLVFAFSNRAEDLTEIDVEQLFRRFYVADPMRSKDSAGLGLAIVRELVQQMDGSIQASLHSGTLTFTITWEEIS